MIAVTSSRIVNDSAACVRGVRSRPQIEIVPRSALSTRVQCRCARTITIEFCDHGLRSIPTRSYCRRESLSRQRVARESSVPDRDPSVASPRVEYRAHGWSHDGVLKRVNACTRVDRFCEGRCECDVAPARLQVLRAGHPTGEDASVGYRYRIPPAARYGLDEQPVIGVAHWRAESAEHAEIVEPRTPSMARGERSRSSRRDDDVRTLDVRTITELDDPTVRCLHRAARCCTRDRDALCDRLGHEPRIEPCAIQMPRGAVGVAQERVHAQR